MAMIIKENKIKIKEYFDSVANEKAKWRKRGWYFYINFEKYIKFLIPENCSVLEIGCETGELLAALTPRRGLGIDFSPKMIEIAQKNFPHLEFRVGDLESLNISETFDYVLLGSVIGYVDDIQNALSQLKKVCRPDTRVIIVYFNYFWVPIIGFAEKIRLRMKRPHYHWFSIEDIENLVYLADFEVVKKKFFFLIPFYIPLISNFFNKFFANIPFFRMFSLLQVLVARINEPRADPLDVTCSVVVPCRNEKKNIEQAVLRIPQMGKQTEIIFVEGHSQDGTLSECERIKNKYPDKIIKVFVQDGEGKGNAVRRGLEHAGGDVLMIFDADLTVSPEELPKFFETIVFGKGEFISGSRLVYKMRKGAMRFLNVFGNRFFSFAFSFLLEQYIKDTLCGTKVFWRKDYKQIKENRSYFGDFDPFGDFELLFGAAKLNLKIIEIPVRYRERTYGSTQIKRFRHGWLLLKMAFFAMGKIKFI